MGTAFIHAENLISEYVYITCNTTGDSFFHVNDRIDAELMGSGDVYYSGSPVVVNKKEKNSGRVLKRD